MRNSGAPYAPMPAGLTALVYRGPPKSERSSHPVLTSVPEGASRKYRSNIVDVSEKFGLSVVL